MISSAGSDPGIILCLSILKLDSTLHFNTSLFNTMAPASPKKKIKKPKAPVAHPTTAVMVNAAIKALKERGGSSLLAFKKYIAANYKADVARLSPFIKEYTKAAVADGRLTQKKGTGASGSFRLGKVTKSKKAKKAKKPKKKKTKKPKKAMKPMKKATKLKKSKTDRGQTDILLTE